MNARRNQRTGTEGRGCLDPVSVLVSGGVIEIVDVEVGSARCDDCGFDTLDPEGSEWYAVADAVWQPVAADATFLCVGCLEERLGRRLTPTDFSPFGIESPSPESRRLADRKAGR